MSSDFHYVAERAIRQCVDVIYYNGVYCIEPRAGKRETQICERIGQNAG
jgi:hypothetical protein